jgi:hypothetical protein
MIIKTIAPTSQTHLEQYISEMLPWAHGHQYKGLAAVVFAIIAKQTGNQAELARTQGNQEAGLKRFSRLIHNPRLAPKVLAHWVCLYHLQRLPRTGKVRVAIDWTSEDDQHLLVISLIIGRRALPVFWRAYDQSVLKGRKERYEHAIIKRFFKLLFQYVERKRVRLTADRGFADVDLFDLLDSLGVRFIIRVKGDTMVCIDDEWIKLKTLSFYGNSHHRELGRIEYCKSKPHRLNVTMSRALNKKGKWETWFLVSNLQFKARKTAEEYAHRFGCEEGFKDTKWWAGFKEAKVKDIQAWSRLFGFFVITGSVLVNLGTKLLLGNASRAKALLRRVASRRKDRCELSLFSATLKLVQQNVSLLLELSAHVKLKLEAALPNVS